MTPAERARRDADSVFHWILIHSDRPRRPIANREDKPALAARVKRSARSAEIVPAVASTPTAEAVAESAGAPAAVAVQPAQPAVEAAIASVPAGRVETAQPPAATAALAVAVVPPPADIASEVPNETLTPVFRPDPQFPRNLLQNLRKGLVKVRFTVLPDGSVAEPTVLTSSNPRLDAAALSAVRQWRFAPLHKVHFAVVDLGFDLN